MAEFSEHAYVNFSRRRWLRVAAAGVGGVGAVLMIPEAGLYAQAATDFIKGPAVDDIKPLQLSKHVWMILSPDSFPTPENRGMMANITFVVTPKGVVVVDSGASLQIGEMAIRMIRSVTPKPVVAVFNTHYHGDHWLGNHAFVDAFGDGLPIHALPHTIEQIRGVAGNMWRSMLERWTNQATVGTRAVAPTKPVAHGQMFDFGGVRLRMHHYGTAHTPSDLTVEVIDDRVTCVGDIAMDRRIANIDDGSYVGTFKYFDALQKATGEQLWVPGHGAATKDLLRDYGELMAGIYESCLQAVKDGKDLGEAKRLVLQDPRVASRASRTAGFESNIGKYVSLAYLEAEQEAF